MLTTLPEFFDKEHEDLLREFEGAQILREYRAAAWQNAVRMPFPGKKDEAWRRISLDALLSTPLEFFPDKKAHLPAGTGISAREAVFYAGTLATGLGINEARLEPALEQAGVIFRDYADVERGDPLLLADINGKVVPPADGKFAAAASALADRGVFLHIPARFRIEKPLLVRLAASNPGSAAFTHNIIKLEAGASAVVVLDFASDGAAKQTEKGLHAGILEIHLGEGADLTLVELQKFGPKLWNITHERAILERDARLHWVYGALGAALSKNFIETSLIGEGAEVKMHGFYFAGGEQVFDLDTQQNHLAARTTSDLLYKGAAAGSSKTVWEGMIYVDPQAMQTDGFQTNRNLVLSAGAEVSALPGLEILADDVRCSHGATIGKLDEDELFYLQTRGIPRVEAEQLIIEGFFGEITAQVPIAELQSEITEIIKARFELAVQR